MTGMGNSTPKQNDPAADRASFISLWQQASKAAAFTPEQSKQVQEILTAAAGKLAENFTALDALRQQKTGTAQQADLNKRIALKEAERDLLVDQAEQSLKSFLSEAQFGLLTMAAFHGVSQNHMESHQQNVHGGMNTTMDGLEQKAMDLGTLAGQAEYQRKGRYAGDYP